MFERSILISSISMIEENGAKLTLRTPMGYMFPLGLNEKLQYSAHSSYSQKQKP